MTTPKKPKLSEHIRQRTQEWFRKAEHELAYLELSPFDSIDFVYPSPFPDLVSVEEAKLAIEKARQIKDFVLKRAEALGYYQD